jgi:hypothetical protein
MVYVRLQELYMSGSTIHPLSLAEVQAVVIECTSTVASMDLPCTSMPARPQPMMVYCGQG